MEKHVKIPIFCGELVLIHGMTLPEVQAKYNYNGNTIGDAVTWSEVDGKGVTGYIIAFAYCTPSVIAHEAVHIATLIMRERNIPVEYGNDEVQAYLVGWVVEQCHKYLKVT